LTPPLAAQTVTQSFAGLDFDTAKGADGIFRPPDTILGANGTHVLHATNSAIRLYTTSGTIVTTTNLNAFFGSNISTEKALFDPRVVYDRLGPNQRFWVVALQRNENVQPQTASIYLAISRAASPTNLDPGSWCTYKIDSVLTEQSDGKKTWADFPMVGVGSDAFLISNDQFTFPPEAKYRHAVVRVINKPVATNNAPPLNCPLLSSFLALTQELAGTRDTSQMPNQRKGHVQPTVHYTAPSSFPGVSNPAYMVSAVVPPSSTYRVWRVRNTTAGGPIVDSINLTASVYDDEPTAKQPSPSFLLDINDSRIMQVAATGDRLWAVQTVRCDYIYEGDGSQRRKPCIRVLAIFVGSSGTTLTAFLQQELTLASWDSEFDLGYFMPSIAVNGSGQTAVVFLTSGPTRKLSAAWTVKNLVDAVYAAPTLFPFGEGTCKRSSSRAKVGDYVGAQTEPVGLSSFWLAGERTVCDGGGPECADSVCGWATQIVRVAP
ncbi:MAG: hypothetical protein ACRD2T_13315, partial [Thermoanaerobaculia bacterium]